MIILRPSGVREDSGDSSSLPARTGNNSLLLALWSWRSWAKRREPTSPRSIVDIAPSLPSAVLPPLPSLPPTALVPSSSPVVTSYSLSFSSSDEPSPTPSNPSIPLETTSVSTNTPLPESTPFWSHSPSGSVTSIYPTESMSETTIPNISPIATPTVPISDDSPILLSAVTPTAAGETDNGLGLDPGLSSAVTNMGDVAPESTTKQGSSTQSPQKPMVGVIFISIFVTCLLLLGIIFYLRRRVSRESRNPTADTTYPMTAVSSHPVSSQTMGKQEGGVTMLGRDSFIDRASVPNRESAMSVAPVQEQRNHPGRCSQISVASTVSRSIRFAVSGSYNSSAGSRLSRTTMSIIAVDGTHSPCDVSCGDRLSPWRPTSVTTSSEYSASWRGTNLSNIINAARGIKH